MPLKLNPCVFQEELATYHDQDFVKRVVTTCRNGVDIGYQGPDHQVESDNWPSAYNHSEVVRKALDKDLALGRKVGPFSQLPFDSYAVSPMGVFEKKRSPGRFRIINDLSWPPGLSVNDFISSEQFSLTYISVDDVVQRIQRHGPGTLLSKLDLADAFHHVVVHPSQWRWLASSWFSSDANNRKVKEYYISTVLPFGLRSAPSLFTDFAFATKLIMLKRGVTECEHYLDDYITIGPPDSQICQSNLDTMLAVCDDVGFDVNPNKVVGPTNVLEFLGIILDTNRMELRISEDRLSSILMELQEWQGRKRAKKREILSLIGKLVFISRVVRSGRTFVRRLIFLAKKVKHLHYTVKLNKDFQADIHWWLTFLPTWNGISLMYQPTWISNAQLHLYTDASNVAVAGYFNGSWFVELVEDLSASINWRELYAVVLSVATWGEQWAGKRILFHCDNQCVCQILRSGTSRNPALMKLIRQLFFITASYQIEFGSVYINTKVNDIADSLSRLDFSKFWRLVPDAEVVMTTPAKLPETVY